MQCAKASAPHSGRLPASCRLPELPGGNANAPHPGRLPASRECDARGRRRRHCQCAPGAPTPLLRRKSNCSIREPRTRTSRAGVFPVVMGVKKPGVAIMHGPPQQRGRLYALGVRRERTVAPFGCPRPLPPMQPRDLLYPAATMTPIEDCPTHPVHAITTPRPQRASRDRPTSPVGFSTSTSPNNSAGVQSTTIDQP